MCFAISALACGFTATPCDADEASPRGTGDNPDWRIAAPKSNGEHQLLRTAEFDGNGVVVYGRPYNEPCFADYVPTPGEAKAELSAALAVGESEPVQVGVYVPRSLSAAKRVSVRVQCDLPHQVGYVYHHAPAPIWRPADRRADGQPKAYAAYPGGRQAMPRYLVAGDTIPQVDAGRSAAFWVTFSATGSATGEYSGAVTVSVDGEPVATRRLRVHVAPFRLPVADAAFALYYRPDRVPRFWQKQHQAAYARDMAAHGLNTGQIEGFFAEFGRDQYRNEGRVDLPQTAGSWIEPWTDHLAPEEYADGRVDPERLLAVQIELFQSAGLATPRHPVFTVQGDFKCPNKQLVADKLRDLSISRGWPEILLQTRDEPPPRLAPPENPGQRGRLDPSHAAAMLDWKRIKNCRTFTAMTGPAAFAWGPLHDVWIVLAGHVTPEMLAEADRLGAEVWTYSERLRFTNFRANRFYYGLYTWGLGLKGNASYCYAHYVHQPPAGEGSMDPVWSFDHGRPTFDHVNGYVLPSDRGPVPGIGFEGLREGIDDYRYLRLLEQCIDAAPEDSAARREALAWVKSLRSRISSAAVSGVFGAGSRGMWELDWTEPCPGFQPRDYPDIRSKAAELIARMPPAPGESERTATASRGDWPPSQWEGERFATASLDECLRALAAADPGTRRAACAALRFKEVASDRIATVIDALAACLSQPETRCPAMTAIGDLAASGGDAADFDAAAKRVVGLLDHEDPFIRCGAVLTLDTLGTAGVEGLDRAAHDPFDMVSRLAHDCLQRRGDRGE